MVIYRAKLLRIEGERGFAIPQEAAELLGIGDDTEYTLKVTDRRTLLVEFDNGTSIEVERLSATD